MADIHKYLDLSLANITQGDSKMLEDASQNTTLIVGIFNIAKSIHDYILVVYSYEHGFFIPITDALVKNFPNLSSMGYSGAFVKVLKYAKKKECRLVCLDRDADVLDELERFEW